MNGHCISQIKVKLDEHNKVEVSFVKKDIENVRKEISLALQGKNQLHADDATSVDMFVKANLDKKIVIGYKLYKVHDDQYPLLQDDDFFLALMTGFQVECCDNLQYDWSCVCIDATHNVGNGFKLITVLIINEFYQGKPLAFCISKRENGSVLASFSEAIKTKVNRPLLSKIFMSDDAEFFYKTWKSVMDPEYHHNIQRLLCTWHVNRAWKTNVQSRVTDNEKRKEVQEKLFAM
jgi:hypothetical protein